MKGITTVIKKVFVPHFKFKKLRNVPKNVGGLRKRAACRRGKLLDKELSEFAKTGLSDLFCVETHLVIEKLTALNLKVIDTQVYVCDTELKICAYIDVLAIDQSSGQHIIIETKRGCHYRLCSTKNGVLKFHGEMVTDCMQHQHQLQALLGKMLYEKTQSVSCVCCLMYVDNTNCVNIPEEHFKVQVSQQALDAIRTFTIKKKHRKRQA